MSNATEVTTVRITRTVSAIFEPDEYLPVRGDVKGDGHRIARALQIEIEYRLEHGSWTTEWSPIRALVQQQRVNGSWSDAQWQRWPNFFRGAADEIRDRYMPTSSYTVTEVNR